MFEFGSQSFDGATLALGALAVLSIVLIIKKVIKTTIILILTLVIAALVFLYSKNQQSNVDPPTFTGSVATSTDVKAMLNYLEVDDAQTALPYPGDKFGGDYWQQIHNCKTDARVYIAEAQGKYLTKINDCRPTSGTWISPYSGKILKNTSEMEIDHLVPKEEAWLSGAYAWTDAQRKAFKNDLGYAPTLMAVQARENEQKHSDQPGFGKNHFLPSSLSYRCTYIAEWIAVKYRWSLSVDSDEKARLENLLVPCDGKIQIPIPKLAR